MSTLPPAQLYLLQTAADDVAAWLPRQGDLPPALLDLALHVAALGSDDEVNQLLALPGLAQASWQQAEQQAKLAAELAALAQADGTPCDWQPIDWAEGQSPWALLQGLLPVLLTELRQTGSHPVQAHPPGLRQAWHWRNQWLLDLARTWAPRRSPLYTLPLRVPAGAQRACLLKLMLWDPQAGAARLGSLQLYRVHAPGARLALAPLPASAWTPLTLTAQQALDDVRALLLEHLPRPEDAADIALAWDVAVPAGTLWAQDGPSAGGALALGGLWLLHDLLPDDTLRRDLAKIQPSMLADTHITAAIADALGQLGGVGHVAGKPEALRADAQARGQPIHLHTAAADAKALASVDVTITGHTTLAGLVQHLAGQRARLTLAQDRLLQALLRHDPNQLVPPAIDDDTLRQVAEADPVRNLPQYALQRWAWWARAAQGELHNRFVPLQLAPDGASLDGATCTGLEQLLHVHRDWHLPALLLRGAPGAGKSTLLQHHEQHLCHRLLLQWQAGQPVSQVPFYLPLSSLRPGDDPVDDWLPRMLKRVPGEVAILLDAQRRADTSPDPVLLLDGLNELDPAPGITRNQRAVAVLQALRPHVSPAGPLLLCARSHHLFDLNAALRVAPVDVLPWTDDEVETYIGRRLGAGGAALMAQLRQAPKVLELCRTPFNLNGLCRLWERGARQLPAHRADLFRRLLWEALVHQLTPPEGTRPRNTPLRDADLLSPAQVQALCQPGVLDRARLPPWPDGPGELLRALFRQGRQQWMQLGQRQPPVPARERGAVELPWNDPADATRPPDARQSVVHWLTEHPTLGPDTTRRTRWRQAVADLHLLDDFRTGGQQGATDAERTDARFKWRHQSWGEWLASVDLLPHTPEQMPEAEREVLAAQLRQGNAFVHATPEAELQHLQDQDMALWDASQWPAPHTHYWQRLLDDGSDEAQALACPVDEVQQVLRDSGWSDTSFRVQPGVAFDAMSTWQKYLHVGAISLRAGDGGQVLCQPHLAKWGNALGVAQTMEGLRAGEPWHSRPDGWRILVVDLLWSPFEDRIWRALGEPRQRALTGPAGHLQGPPVGDLDEVLGLALLGLPDAVPWLRWLLLQRLWWPLAPVLADLQRLLEGDPAGAWTQPRAELQHLRRVLLLLSVDAGQAVADRVLASGMLDGLDDAAGLPPDDPLQRQWQALRAGAFQGGVDLRLRLQAGAMLGTLGDSLRYERVPAAGGPGLRLRAGVWAGVPAGRHGIGSGPHDGDARANEQPAFESPALPAFQIARLQLTVAEWQHFIDAVGYAADAPWWQADAVGPAGVAWLQGRQAGGRVHRPRGWGHERLRNPLQPVVGITLFEALAYAAWAATMPPDAPAPAVPTELQWEAGVRGRPLAGGFDAGGQAVWPWPVPAGGPGVLDFNHARTRWGWPSPVGVFSTSDTASGVADAAGNTWEWCCNALPGDAMLGYDTDGQQAAAGAAFDPSDATSERALRGGAYYNTADDCRPAIRGHDSPDYHVYDFGVRLVRLWLPHSGPRTPSPD